MKPGHVLEEHQGDVEGVAQHDEARGLVGRVDIERAAEHHGLVGDDADGAAAQPREAGDQVLRPARLDLEDASAVHDGRDDLLHVIGAPRAVGHDGEQRLVHPVRRIVARPRSAAARGWSWGSRTGTP